LPVKLLLSDKTSFKDDYLRAFCRMFYLKIMSLLSKQTIGLLNLKDQRRLSLDSPWGLSACHGKPKLNVHFQN